MTERGWLQRPATEWTSEALTELTGSEEGLLLEFKKASELIADGHLDRNTLRREISETSSAFLNSEGGVILIGVQTTPDPVDKKREVLKSVMDWSASETLEGLGLRLTASQVADVIHGNISPTATGILVRTVEVALTGGSSCSVHVVTVPPSQTGAHQAVPTFRY